MRAQCDKNEPIDEPCAARELSPTTVVNFREKTASVLDRLAVQAKAALANEGTKLDLFSLIQNSAPGVVHLGTFSDPDDVLWDKVTTIVRTILRELTGLDNAPGRDLVCAMAN